MASNFDPIYTYKENKFYKKYEKEKEQIKKKYPPRIFEHTIPGRSLKVEFKQYIESEDRELHNQYLKEIADLLFTPNGTFQQMVWDTMGDVEKEEMERRARGRIGGNGEYR